MTVIFSSISVYPSEAVKIDGWCAISFLDVNAVVFGDLFFPKVTSLKL
jgi:hypothetical protein